MKIASLIAISTCTQAATAFVCYSNNQHHIVARSSAIARPMGLFDFFSEDARREREERKQREIEEQEELQREILARRSNPEKMDEYQARVRVRRALRMNGNDDAADNVGMFTDDEKNEQLS